MSIEYNAATLALHTHSLWVNVRILFARNPLVSLLMAGVYSDHVVSMVLCYSFINTPMHDQIP